MMPVKRCALLLIAAFALVLGTPGRVSAGELLAARALRLAEDVGRWLSDNAVKRPDGIAWPDDALDPESLGYDLGSGVAGKVIYFVALYRATGNQDYLDLASGGADYLVALLQDVATFDANDRRAGLYTGLPGIGVALVHVQQQAQKKKYSDALSKVLDLLGDWSIEDADGLHWSDDFNDLLFGEAGTVLFVSWYAEQTGDRHAAVLAHRGAQFLLGQAIKSDVGKY
jgi:hypothetical protein